MTVTARRRCILVLLVVAAAGCGGRAGAPPGQVKNATGYNPASGKVHAPDPVPSPPSPGVNVKLKAK